ncbi:P1 family peptidase [Sporosalibacterium faouarense]|uniref:DmpA family aminopeptidase n=1 Tax=Sporosalibacterium faouarense TaxID=516123 RepID=UPI00192CA568|nr:P1 family peptidase [Sporosalibacterium faouarense]
MKNQKRIRGYGIEIGEMTCGVRNSITDVKGVEVGHITLNENDIKTGVTAILPHQDNLFKEKLIAASYVINGFGKTIGTIQINELGTIETPIILTNTLSVGVGANALVKYMLEDNDDIGKTTGTVNPIVCECNDAYLNDIRGFHVNKEHILCAIANASPEFEEGAVGAGTGMSCYGLKGGIGTASRILKLDDREYTVGILVLSNFGRGKNLIIDGIKAGQKVEEIKKARDNSDDKGSIIMILATDIPMTSRQLKRISKRAGVGLSRTGSYMGHGSGEIVISFSTANRIKHYEKNAICNFKIFNENKIDDVFTAVAEVTEEAVLNSLICADTTIGRDGHVRYSLKNYIGEILK